MADRYQQFADSPAGRIMLRRLGLPQPVPLRRGPDPFDGSLLVGGATTLRAVLERMHMKVVERASDGERYDALIFDASRVASTRDLRDVYDFFQPVIRSLAPSGRASTSRARCPQSESPSRNSRSSPRRRS